MKKYYSLRRDISPKTIGVRNAGAQVSFEKDKMKDDDFYENYMHYFHGENSSLNLYKTPNFNGVLNYLKLNKGAKITDLMTFMPYNCGAEFLLNKNAYDIFNKYNLGNHTFFNTKVSVNKENKMLDYYMFYIRTLGLEVVNFEKSVFYTGNSIRGKKLLHFTSYNDYKANSDYKHVEKITIYKNKFDEDLDVFIIPFSSSIFISKSLKDEINKAKLTGGEIYEVSNDSFVIE